METFDHPLAVAPSEIAQTSDSSTLHPKGIKAWWIAENTKSLDGLPALRLAYQAPRVPLNTFNRKAPVKYGRLVRVLGDVSEDMDKEGASGQNNNALNGISGFVCKDKDKRRVEGNTSTKLARQGKTREVIPERRRSENLKVVGAFSLGVFLTSVYFRLAGAWLLRNTYI